MLLCKAMSFFRTDQAARLQASACGALAALADRVDGCSTTLLEFSVPPLIEQVICGQRMQHANRSLVHACSW